MADISAKKLSQWITKISLHTTRKPEGQEAEAIEAEAEEEVDEDGNLVAKKAQKEDKNYAEEPVDSILPIIAVVRVRIPKLKPDPEMDDEGNPIATNFNESELEEIPFVD